MNLRSEIGRSDLIVRVGGKPVLDGRTHPLGPAGLVPEVNYLPCFENDDLPRRLHVFHVVCRVNHHSRNRVNNSLRVAGGCADAAVYITGDIQLQDLFEP